MRRVHGEDVNPVTEAEAEELAAKIKAIHYYETSAKKDIGVMDAFNAAVIAAHSKPRKHRNKCSVL